MIDFRRFQLRKYEKPDFAKQSFFHKKYRIHQQEHEKPTLHSLIANHVLEISIKLKFQCVRFKKEALFCSGGFQSVSYLFLSRPVHTMRLVS